MAKPNTARRNLSFVSIRKGSSKNLLPYTNGQEKDETPVLDIEAVRTIGRILGAIKAKIAGTGPGGNLPGAAATGPNSSQNTHSERR